MYGNLLFRDVTGGDKTSPFQALLSGDYQALIGEVNQDTGKTFTLADTRVQNNLADTLALLARSFVSKLGPKCIHCGPEISVAVYVLFTEDDFKGDEGAKFPDDQRYVASWALHQYGTPASFADAWKAIATPPEGEAKYGVRVVDVQGLKFHFKYQPNE